MAVEKYANIKNKNVLFAFIIFKNGRKPIR